MSRGPRRDRPHRDTGRCRQPRSRCARVPSVMRAAGPSRRGPRRSRRPAARATPSAACSPACRPVAASSAPDRPRAPGNRRQPRKRRARPAARPTAARVTPTTASIVRRARTRRRCRTRAATCRSRRPSTDRSKASCSGHTRREYPSACAPRAPHRRGEPAPARPEARTRACRSEAVAASPTRSCISRTWPPGACCSAARTPPIRIRQSTCRQAACSSGAAAASIRKSRWSRR
jgi:hypothetical protein